MKMITGAFVRSIEYSDESFSFSGGELVLSCHVEDVFLRLLPEHLAVRVEEREGYSACLGQGRLPECPRIDESYVIEAGNGFIGISANDFSGLCHSLVTLSLLLGEDNKRCCRIEDWPVLPNRGLMLDVSRGKTYTLDELKRIVDVIALARFNVFQLYIEHTFAFQNHREIWEGSDPYTRDEILELKEYCSRRCIRLQGNLQSFGHCNRILTRRGLSSLRESDLFWTLSPSDERTYAFLDELYGEFMPLFDDPLFNVCSDETYDIGSGKSCSCSGSTAGEVYMGHLKRLHELAGKYSKKIMVFGDIVLKHPELLASMPDDIVYLDWIYDPKPFYGSPAVFREHGCHFWACPGSGQWNSLFPRFDGMITNVQNLLTESIEAGCEGMLYTDWNDHGGYAMSGFALYGYIFAGLVAWTGRKTKQEAADRIVDFTLGEPVYSRLMHLFASLYILPPLWSKNRSECVMALFDEPVFGRAVRGPVPPAGLEAYNLDLPEGVTPVLEPHAHHPLRPYFSIPDSTCRAIERVAADSGELICRLSDSILKREFSYVRDAFRLLVDKLDLSHRVIRSVESGKLAVEDFVYLEDEVRLMIRRFARLQLDFCDIWRSIARDSEIEISLSYFASVTSRLVYLRSWLETQREAVSRGYMYDSSFSSYETAGYETLPTY